MKKISRAILAMSAAAMVTGAAASAAEETRITFCVGEEILSINGNDIKVEKPYVVGDGVTLVPLRVITEAFGAEVEWVQDTKTINLSYPEVDIILQIGNPTAEVNQKAETLLVAPELTEGSTMVPLRFISETFGAEVSYDSETKKITVLKKADGDKPGDTVQSSITQAYIGDSTWGWSMENPSDAIIETRSFDGSFTDFKIGKDNYLSISVVPLDEDYDFEMDFNTQKDGLKDYTLVLADKTTENPKMIHFRVKNKNEFGDLYRYVTDKYIFSLSGTASMEDEKAKDEIVRVLSTFKCEYPAGGDIYDLSDVKDGYREYKSESLNFSINVPQDFDLVSSEDVENEVDFAKFDNDRGNSRISFNVYSKSAVGSAKELAEKDRENNIQNYNPELIKVGEIEEKKYADLDCIEYVANINGKNLSIVQYDVFFEAGEYTYNVGIMLPKSENTDREAKAILDSIKAGEIDADKAGVLMRNDSDYEGAHKVALGGMSFDFPNSYQDMDVSADTKIFKNMKNGGAMIMLSVSNANGTKFSDIKQQMAEVESNVRADSKSKIVSSARTKTINNTQYTTMTFYAEDDDGNVQYCCQTAGIKNNKLIVFTLNVSEYVYSDNLLKEAEDIISSAIVK